MANPLMNDPVNNQIAELLSLALEHEITDDQIQQLNALVKNHPDRIQFAVNYLQLSSALKFSKKIAGMEQSWNAASPNPNAIMETLALMAEDEKLAPAVEPEIPLPEIQNIPPKKPEAPQVNYRIKKRTIASIAAIITIIFYIHFVQYSASKSKNSCVARLINTVDAQWETVSGNQTIATDLCPGPMKLTHGLAEIQLNSGVNVIIEAPTQFTLESSSQLFLQQGRLVAKIDNVTDNPFVVRSTHASIVDYGTEFGVQVDTVGNTLTHVYQGKVELRSGSNPLRFENSMVLVQNQAGLADNKGSFSSQEGLAGRFVRRHEFNTKAMAARGSAYHRWLAYRYQLQRDPDLVAYYTFERDSKNPDQLINMANATSGMLNGTLKAANPLALPIWTEGRWPQTTALLFDRSQKQYVQVPPNPAFSLNGPITVAAWVNCSGPDDGGHILSNRVGVRSLCNYQLGYRSPTYPEWKHGMHLSRKKDSQDKNNQIYSKTLPDVSGWVLIAATHDNQVVKFYLNGKRVDVKNWPVTQPLEEAGLMIGSDFSPDDPSRFNGKLSEIIIARRVFSEQEMAEMFQAGKP